MYNSNPAAFHYQEEQNSCYFFSSPQYKCIHLQKHLHAEKEALAAHHNLYPPLSLLFSSKGESLDYDIMLSTEASRIPPKSSMTIKIDPSSQLQNWPAQIIIVFPTLCTRFITNITDFTIFLCPMLSGKLLTCFSDASIIYDYYIV